MHTDVPNYFISIANNTPSTTFILTSEEVYPPDTAYDMKFPDGDLRPGETHWFEWSVKDGKDERKTLGQITYTTPDDPLGWGKG